MELSTALGFKLKHGKHAGHTLRWVATHDPGHLAYLLERNAGGDGSDGFLDMLKIAARLAESPDQTTESERAVEEEREWENPDGT